MVQAKSGQPRNTIPLWTGRAYERPSAPPAVIVLDMPPEPQQSLPGNTPSDATQYNHQPGFQDKSLKNTFIRKVYAIITCQMLITTGSIALFLYIPSVKTWVMTTPYLLPAAVVPFLICAAVLALEDRVRRRAPVNVVFLVIFTLAECWLLGYITSLYNTPTIFMATGMVAAVCLTLTLFACESGCGTLTCFTVVPLMSYGIYWFFVLHQDQNRILELVCASIAAFAVCCFLVYDMRQIVFRSKYSVMPYEYMFAVLNISWDVITVTFIILMWFAINVLLSFICLRISPRFDTESETNR